MKKQCKGKPVIPKFFNFLVLCISFFVQANFLRWLEKWTNLFPVIFDNVHISAIGYLVITKALHELGFGEHVAVIV